MIYITKRIVKHFLAGRTIAGYYTLSQYAIELEDVPEEVAKKLPKYALVPATLLGRLAVSIDFRGKGLAKPC